MTGGTTPGRMAAVFAGLVLVAHPVFPAIYRLSVFSTVPRDDYAPFLLWLLGVPGGFVPESPYVYRVLSMVAAAPFYALPALPLTNTPAGLPAEYLRATGALSMLAYLSSVAYAVLAGAGALRVGLGRLEAVLAGALAAASVLYVQVTGIDPTALAVTAAGVLLVQRLPAFAALVLVSVAVNEKVALVLALWLGVRCATSRTDRATLGPQFLAAAGAVALYAAAVKLLHLPGNTYQTEPGRFLGTVAQNAWAYLTPRGLLLNVLPALVLLAGALGGRAVGPFRRRDALLVPALLGVALVLTQLFQAGRIAMHAAPVMVIPAAAGLGAWLRRPRASAD